MRTLRQQVGTAARALEFGVLCAARTGEILGCRFDEIDSAGIWRVPAARMKGGEEHTVFLPPRALEIVDAQRLIGSAYAFPSPVNKDKPMSNMAMLTLLRRMKFDSETTVHGLCRASFSSWANEHAVARPDVIEAALAHRERDRVRVRGAYNRASFDNERRALLSAWALYCDGQEFDSGTTAPLPRVIQVMKSATLVQLEAV